MSILQVFITCTASCLTTPQRSAEREHPVELFTQELKLDHGPLQAAAMHVHGLPLLRLGALTQV